MCRARPDTRADIKRGHKSETTLTADSELNSVDSPGTRDRTELLDMEGRGGGGGGIISHSTRDRTELLDIGWGGGGGILWKDILLLNVVTSMWQIITQYF